MPASWARIVKLLRSPASLCSLVDRHENPIPTRFLTPIDCLKIPALFMVVLAASSQIRSPLLGDKADYNIGLSYRPASLYSHKEKKQSLSEKKRYFLELSHKQKTIRSLTCQNWRKLSAKMHKWNAMSCKLLKFPQYKSVTYWGVCFLSPRLGSCSQGPEQPREECCPPLPLHSEIQKKYITL